MIMPLRGHAPTIGSNVFLASSADIIGEVELGDRSSVWFRCVLRGDVSPIRIGKETNIQDGTVIHGTLNQSSTQVGDRVTIGHSVVLHGCEIGSLCLIGMGAILLDHAKIPERCMVGAGSLVTLGAEFEPGTLILGSPARIKRDLTKEELAFLDKSADNYLEYMTWYQQRSNQ